ncbi:DUF6884 domain-containing protein [Salibacterium aidingense]|uniref:DUF6884 domain-containing protein n=1 Tax=Salibacterium aidingense TaxID=384933 RepID=UPI000422422D|nr:DUF6884 domain-containing protein [Salibacterium aidingense]
MKNLCIIPCGKKKIWDVFPGSGPVYAKDAYQGVLHKKCREYARRNGYGWTILSAKHGFLHPNDIVPENYDTGFHFPKEQIISDDSLTRQWNEKGFYQIKTIILLTGKKHETVIRRVIPNLHHYEWKTPLKGCRGIGEMLQRLNHL